MVVMHGLLRKLFVKELSLSIATGLVLGTAWFVYGFQGRKNKTIAYYKNLSANA